MFGSGFAVHDGADPTWLEIVEEESAAADYEPRHLDDVRDRSDEFTKHGYFDEIARRTYRWDLEYDADGYVALMASMSAFRVLEDDVRQELFERVERRIKASGGTVRPTRVDVLYVATAS